jgi:hypothetical protein
MPKLVIFGDSFSSYYSIGQGPSWMQTLSEKIGCQEIINFSVNGSSLNFSTHELLRYLESPDYAVDDVIVFVFTSHSRTRLVNKNFDPSWASETVNFVSGNSRPNHPATQFYKDHFDYFKSELMLTTHRDHEVDRFKTVLTLKQLPNFTVLLSAFKNVIDFKGKSFMLADTHNFLLIDADLFSISQGELKQGCDFHTFYNFFKGEVRNCHLGKTNNQVLADLLSLCICNKSRDYFDRTQFKQNFIGLSQEYESVYKEELGAKWTRYKTQHVPDWYPFAKK